MPGTELLEAEEMELEELDQFVLPDMTDAEQLRKKEWPRIPRQARQALRKLHHMLGHKLKAVMRQVLKAGGAPPEQLAGVELFHCDKCDEAVPPLRLHPVKAQARYTFNHEVLIDVIEAKDAAGERFSFLSIVCNSTLFHVVAMVRPGGGTPSSRKCAAKFAASWVAWAGWLVCVTCDRGVHNWWVFAQVLSAHGVYLTTAGVEAAEQIGRCERHGGMIKQNLSLVVTACGIKGKAAMKMAAATCVSAKNELVRHGGIAPSQWVLGKFPRGVGHMLEEEELGQLGVLEHQTDSATELGMRAKWRLESMKAFVQQDCSARLARARLRQSGPRNMEFKAGDLIMCRKAEGPRWHGPGASSVLITKCCGPYIIGPRWQWQQEERGDRISERTIDQLRAAEQQQGFVDISGRRRMRSEVEAGKQDEELEQPPVRARTTPTASSEGPQLEQRSSVAGVEVGRTTSAEGEGESQQPEAVPATPLEDAWLRRNPDGAPDPGIRLVGHLRGRPGSAAASSVADRERSKSRAHGEGDGSGDRETANFAALMARAENVEERHRDDAVEATGQFIDWQARWSERMQENSTEEWKQKRMRALDKSQELQKRRKLLQYAKEPEHVQRGLDEARLTESKKWQKHSAAISAQEAARLVMEGAEEIGTQWVEVDRNEKIRVESEQTGEAKHVSMNLKSRPVALGNQEKREMRGDSPTADAEGIHLVFSFASFRKAKVRCGDLESAYFTGERMSRVLLLRQPRSGLPGLKPDDRLLARVPVYGTRDAGRGFWKKFRPTLIAGGVRENRVLSAVYIHTDS